MQAPQSEIGNVVYNATEQTFEALVTLYDQERRVSYPCSFQGPIHMSFERAAKGLVTQALRRHGKPAALGSAFEQDMRPVQLVSARRLRRGLPEGEYGFFRGRAA